MDFNTEKRMLLILRKIFLNNDQFCLRKNNGKFMKKNVKLINNAEDFLKYTSKPTYIIHDIFGKDYAAIHEIKPVLILNKPIYVGFTVLDLSKWKMYDFH